MTNSLSNPYDNFAEGIHKVKCQNETMCEMCGIQY